jgi:hypothetical protein
VLWLAVSLYHESYRCSYAGACRRGRSGCLSAVTCSTAACWWLTVLQCSHIFLLHALMLCLQAQACRLLEHSDPQQCHVLVAASAALSPTLLAARLLHALLLCLQARAFRLLDRSDLQQCRVLVADSASSAVPADVAVPSGNASVYHMPRFSPVRHSSSSVHFSACLLACLLLECCFYI